MSDFITLGRATRNVGVWTSSPRSTAPGENEDIVGPDIWDETRDAALPGRLGVIVNVGTRLFEIVARGDAVGSFVADADGYVIEDDDTSGEGRVVFIGRSGVLV